MRRPDGNPRAGSPAGPGFRYRPIDETPDRFVAGVRAAVGDVIFPRAAQHRVERGDQAAGAEIVHQEVLLAERETCAVPRRLVGKRGILEQRAVIESMSASPAAVSHCFQWPICMSE